MRQLFKLLQTAWQNWQRSSVVVRTMSAWFIVLLVVVGIVLWQHHKRTSHEWLLAGQQFSQRERTRIETAFAEASLNDYEVRERGILIPRSMRSEYVRAISQAKALPEETYLPQQEAIAQSSVFESSRQQSARIKLALERELAISIQRMPGIENARVHIDEAMTGVGLKRENRVSAGVVVMSSAKNGLPAIRVESIRRLVAAAKVELVAVDVTVTDVTAGVTYGGDSNNSSEGFADRLLFEKHCSDEIHNLLKIPGAEVSAHLDADLPNTHASAMGWNAHRVRVNVGVPDAYYREILARLSAADRQGQGDFTPTTLAEVEEHTRARIRNTVIQFLNVTEEDAASRITILTFPSLVTNRVAESQDSNVILIPKSWTSSIMLISLMFALFALFGLKRGDSRNRRKKGAEEPDESKSPLRVINDPSVNDAEDGAELAARATGAGHSAVGSSVQSAGDSESEVSAFQAELNRLVREDPKAAAEKLQQWVNKAG